MFLAVTRLASETIESPVIGQIAGDAFPKKPELIVVFERLREAQDVSVNQFNPVMNHGRLRGRAAFVQKTGDRGAERRSVKLGYDWRRGVRNGPLRGGLLVTDPAEFPG